MPLTKPVEIKPATGKLGILLPGMGAVATTFMAGVDRIEDGMMYVTELDEDGNEKKKHEVPFKHSMMLPAFTGVDAVRRGRSKPIGSLTQMGTIRLGKRTDNRSPLIRDFIPLARLDDISFAGWDLFPDDAYQAASKAGVLTKEHLAESKSFLSSIKPMSAVFEQAYVKRLTATHAKTGTSKQDLAEQVMADIEGFRKRENLDRMVMVWCGSTEAYHEVAPVHASLASFEKGVGVNLRWRAQPDR